MRVADPEATGPNRRSRRHAASTRLLLLSRHITSAAQSAAARLIVLDNVYAVGATGSLNETTPEQACSRQRRIRQELADDLRALHARGDLPDTIGSTSEFVGPGADNTTLLHPRAVARLHSGATADVLGEPDQPRSWSYTPDVAEGLFPFGFHSERASQALHLPVLPAQTGRGMLPALAAALGVSLRARRMPRRLLRATGLFSPLMRELPEMRYPYEYAFVTSDARIRTLLPIPPMPLAARTRATATWIRALPEAS